MVLKQLKGKHSKIKTGDLKERQNRHKPSRENSYGNLSFGKPRAASQNMRQLEKPKTTNSVFKDFQIQKEKEAERRGSKVISDYSFGKGDKKQRNKPKKSKFSRANFRLDDEESQGSQSLSDPEDDD
mmetsp:Transcript_10221/g.15555  ORF Transcript_10221/g.15555 Transcript_10221/m.15555 type:complete len:127 (-) Transcript_10221:4757-5137(-)